jgi:hypothetical protein
VESARIDSCLPLCLLPRLSQGQKLLWFEGQNRPFDIWIDEKAAEGEALQRWKDNGVFAYERIGGRHLLVGLNKDAGTTQTINVQTGFGPHQELENLVDDTAPRIKTDAHSNVKITIPKIRGPRLRLLRRAGNDSEIRAPTYCYDPGL